MLVVALLKRIQASGGAQVHLRGGCSFLGVPGYANMNEEVAAA